MKEVQLPIQKNPAIQSEGLLAYCIALLYNHPYFEQWYYSHHITVQFVSPDKKESEAVPYLRFFSLHSKLCDLLDYEDVQPAACSADVQSRLKWFKEKMAAGYYVFLQVNEKYVPNTKAEKDDRDYLHGQLLYGYSETKQEFYMLTYDIHSKVLANSITYFNMEKAIQTASPTLPYTFYKYKSTTYEYDYFRILSSFLCYSGCYEQLVDESSGTTVSTGSQAVERLTELLISSKSNTYYDIRPVAGFREHKQVILDSLYHLKKLGFRVPDETIQEYRPVVQKALLVEMLYMKYNITRNATIIDKMVALIKETLEVEKRIFPEMAEMIAKAYLGLQ